MGRPLTLISAPAGAGKTTLLSTWLAAQSRPAAWLGLDSYDTDFSVFVRYFVTAVQTVHASFGTATLALFHLPQPSPVDYLAATLLDELAGLPDACIIALDDYHVIQDPAIHTLVSQLVSGLPPTVHLVIATRADPPLPLARWRTHGQLAELRADDLHFDSVEVQTFLEHILGAVPPVGIAEAFMERTEGWIAGVQLASLTLKTSPDPLTWTAAFRTGTQRHVREFLLDDVLAQQPAHVQEFLLRTSVLDRFCGSLCDALWDEPLQAPSAQVLLDRIERENLFVVGLDHEQAWYRYHHLFQEALLHRLRARSDGPAVADLRRRASRWLESAGLIDEALQQALAASDPVAAARIVEAHSTTVMNLEDWPRLQRWLNLLPPDLVPTRPALLVVQALVQRIRGQYAALEASLRSVEASLDNGATHDDTARSVVRGYIDVLWSDYYFHTGDATHSLAHARRGLEGVPDNHYFVRGLAALYAGITRYQLGDGAAAVAELRTEWAKGTPASAVYTGRVLIGLMSNYEAAGDLPHLEQVAHALLRLSSDHALPVSAPWADFALGLAAYQRNDLDAAEQHFAAVIEAQHDAHFLATRDALLGLSLTYQAQGRTALARSIAQRASQHCLDSGNESQLAATRALEAWLACLRGDVAAASQWLRSWQEEEPPVLWLCLVVPRLIRARVLVAQNTPQSLQLAARELTALGEACEEQFDVTRLIQTLALQAVVYHAQDRTDEALAGLSRAVQLAEPGGFVRPFLEAGAPMADLLGRLVAQGPISAHARRLLEAFSGAAGEPAPAPASPPHPEQIVESLTWREAEVLGLLAARLSNKEIAQRLSISTETVKQHATNIYQKLQVSGRREAVLRAGSLGLLAPAEPEAAVLVPVASPQRTSALTEPAARETGPARESPTSP
ncbi:MAG TPA: LuxR C-terminal-related transcriptional regulator [Chloroflexota bacterium]